jgi:chromosome segregation ATPase
LGELIMSNQDLFSFFNLDNDFDDFRDEDGRDDCRGDHRCRKELEECRRDRERCRRELAECRRELEKCRRELEECRRGHCRRRCERECRRRC